jgi:hypothetical protein
MWSDQISAAHYLSPQPQRSETQLAANTSTWSAGARGDGHRPAHVPPTAMRSRTWAAPRAGGAKDKRGMGMRTPHADDLFCTPGFVHAQQRSGGLHRHLTRADRWSSSAG